MRQPGGGRSARRAVACTSPLTWGAIATLVAIQMLFTYKPVMQKLFQSRPRSLDAWIAIIAAAGSVFVLVDIKKYLLRAPKPATRTITYGDDGRAATALDRWII
jgi:magnesium-transporting ATPase (P-type)